MVVLVIFENLILLLLICICLVVAVLVLVITAIHLVRIGSSDELALHVKDVSLGVHQVLLSFPLNLDGSEHLVVPQVHALLISAVVLLTHLPIIIQVLIVVLAIILLSKLLLVLLTICAIILEVAILMLHDVCLLGTVVVTVDIVHIQKVGFFLLLLLLSIWILVLIVVFELLLIYILQLLVIRLLV